MFDGDFDEAERQAQRMQGRYSQAFLPFIDLEIGCVPARPDSGEPTKYYRRLDFRTAEHEVRVGFTGGETVRRVFVSRPHSVLVLTIDTDDSAGVNLELAVTSGHRILATGSGASDAWLTLQLPSDVQAPHHARSPSTAYSADPLDALCSAVALRWAHDGAAASTETDHRESAELSARGVRHAVIYLATQTTFSAIGEAPIGTPKTL